MNRVNPAFISSLFWRKDSSETDCKALAAHQYDNLH